MSSTASREFSAISPVLAERRGELRRVRRGLLIRLMGEGPFQSAMNLWRTVELPELASVLPKSGLGLEIGCGDGYLTGVLADLLRPDWSLTGVDVEAADTAAAVASGRFARVHQRPWHKIPEKSGTFDFAFANNVLQRSTELPRVVREIARCLRPQGLLAATVPSAALFGLLSGATARRAARDRHFADVEYVLGAGRLPTIDQWTTLLDDAGIDVIDISGFLSVRQLRRWERLAGKGRRKRRKLVAEAATPIRRAGATRGLAKPLRFLRHPSAWITAYGVIDDVVENPYEAGGWLILAQRR